MSDSSAPPSGTPANGQASLPPPQKAVTDFWTKFSIEKPENIARFLPPAAHEKFLQKEIARGPTRGNIKVSAGYEAARDECKINVKRIADECRRKNEKWSDPEFDLETDRGFCLHGLFSSYSVEQEPHSVHRVDWIFQKPQFTVGGFRASHVAQGQLGDCWWVAAAAALCNVDGHMDKICVARDEECGVYGFVFFRDGEWISTVVDDNLCLESTVPGLRGLYGITPNSRYGKDFDTSSTYDPRGKKANKWKEQNQTGSEALLYAGCENSHETWLPLLEKAYAKIHGDYEAISGGRSGQGVEDMSGGIATEMYLDRILSKERLWLELLTANQDFIYTLSTDEPPGGDTNESMGLPGNHCYTVFEAVEHEGEDGKSVRLVRIGNPWGQKDDQGKGEWDGPWSDGSEEWTQYWIQKLAHQFKNDGVFYMAFEDVLQRFGRLDRVRLFSGGDWYNSQIWTSVNVPWMATYLDVKFAIDVTEPGVVVFALSQLDHTYYLGLHGMYVYSLHFLLRESGSEDHIALAGTSSKRRNTRSVSAEVELEPGKYELIPKVVAQKLGEPSVADQLADIEKTAKLKPRKLQQIALNHDKAHLKASQWKYDSESVSKDEPTAERRAPDGIKTVQVVVTGGTSMRLTEGSGATESSGPDTVQPPTEEKDEAKKGQPSGDSNDEDKSEKSPWNAVCVIGLRVYSKDAKLGLHLEES